jgi:hypothetical protein
MVHGAPGEHAMPHPPQLLVSLSGSTQASPIGVTQKRFGAAQLGELH